MKETAYLLQAALVSVWWVGLATSNTFFVAFQFEQIPPPAFWAFLIPDALVIALLSVVRAYRQEEMLGYVILGGFAYASLYCLNATILTASGYLPTTLMLLGLAYNILLCFSGSLFRASSSSQRLNVVKTLVQIVCIWVIALAVIPFVIMDAFDALNTPRLSIQTIVAVGLFIGFSLLGIISSYVMVRDGAGTPLPLDQTNQLVVSGPYRYVRNPMAVAGIGQGLAVAMLFGSVPVMVYALLGAFVWHFVVRPIEERDLTQRFGQPYLDYCSRVSCWLPGLSRQLPKELVDSTHHE